MRILNQDQDASLKHVSLFLTMAEAKQLQYDLERLCKKPKRHHAHITSEDYEKEITVSIYDESTQEEYGFGERGLKLIREDK